MKRLVLKPGCWTHKGREEGAVQSRDTWGNVDRPQDRTTESTHQWTHGSTTHLGAHVRRPVDGPWYQTTLSTHQIRVMLSLRAFSVAKYDLPDAFPLLLLHTFVPYSKRVPRKRSSMLFAWLTSTLILCLNMHTGRGLASG